MKLSTRIITAVLIIAGSTGVVYAFGKHGHWGTTPQEKAEFVTERVTKKLELDALQQQKFSELAELALATMQEVRPSREERMNELTAILDEPSFNQARALQLIQQKTDMVNEKAPLLIGAVAGFVDSLDADQKQQLQEFLQQRHHRHGH